MLTWKIILGFGFAVLLPMLIHFGIEMFAPYPNSNYSEQHRLLSALMRYRWSQIHFFVGVPIGTAMTLIGSLIRVQAVGSGLMLGGIFTFTTGCVMYWGHLSRIGRFLVLLIVFGVLLWISYQRLSELKQPKRSAG